MSKVTTKELMDSFNQAILDPETCDRLLGYWRLERYIASMSTLEAQGEPNPFEAPPEADRIREAVGSLAETLEQSHSCKLCEGRKEWRSALH